VTGPSRACAPTSSSSWRLPYLTRRARMTAPASTPAKTPRTPVLPSSPPIGWPGFILQKDFVPQWPPGW